MTKNDIVTVLLAEAEHDESIKDARAKAIKKERQKILQEQMAEERRETLRAWRARSCLHDPRDALKMKIMLSRAG